MKTSKALLCSRNPICGVSLGQENRFDVTNPHTERFFSKLKNRPAVGVWYRLARRSNGRRHKIWHELWGFHFRFENWSMNKTGESWLHHIQYMAPICRFQFKMRILNCKFLEMRWFLIILIHSLKKNIFLVV